MAQSTGQISVVLLGLFLHIIHLSTSSVATQSSYPPESLACKTYNMTKMDCNNRNLPDIPVLDHDFITSLDLSENQLKHITNATFEQLNVLLLLNVSYNEILQMSSTAFRGLRSLEFLDLQGNKLVDLSKGISSDLLNLLYLNLNFNLFTALPGQELAPLYSLEFLQFVTHSSEI